MLDREFCLRYIAFTKFTLDKYNNSIDDFLILAMEFLNESEDQSLEEYYHEFQKTMDVVYKIFGKYSFRKLRSDQRRTPINKAIFEGWSVVISKLTEVEQNKLIQNSEVIRQIDLLRFVKKVVVLIIILRQMIKTRLRID